MKLLFLQLQLSLMQTFHLLLKLLHRSVTFAADHKLRQERSKFGASCIWVAATNYQLSCRYIDYTCCDFEVLLSHRGELRDRSLRNLLQGGRDILRPYEVGHKL